MQLGVRSHNVWGTRWHHASTGSARTARAILKAMRGYNIRKCVEMLIMIMIMVQCRAFLEVEEERIEVIPSRGRVECHDLTAPTFLSAVTMRRESAGNKRRGIMKAHPTVCGPSDTAASMPQSLSTLTDNAYERHGYTLPILAKVKGLSAAVGRCIRETYLMGSHPRAPCKSDSILRRGRGKSHTRLLLGRRSHPFYLYPTATGQWRATV